jgi:hypothetical protein
LRAISLVNMAEKIRPGIPRGKDRSTI